MKLIKNLSVIIFITFIFLESTSFIYFSYVSNDKKNLEIYINKRIGTDSYKYFESVGLVLPKPNIKIYHYTEEFVDIFKTKDILGKGIGFFDDGINNRKIKAVALGDSFTRGVGSIDNLKNGWVELLEKKRKDMDIINLGNFGNGILDQKYSYDQIKHLINHELIIYNFFAGADYIDNVDDKSYSYFIKKKSKELSNSELDRMIKSFNKMHGYKHHLEYLKDTKFKSYSVYFFLKVVDFLNIKNILSTYDFEYILPENEARLNLVDDELYKLKNLKPKKIRCIGEKYCVRENEIFENEDLSMKLVKNTSNLINEFYYEAIKEGKKFILVIHPSSRYFYPNKTNIDYNKLDSKMINFLDKKIMVIDLKKELKKIDKKDQNLKIFYKYDSHYRIEGYKAVSNIIFNNLKKIYP